MKTYQPNSPEAVAHVIAMCMLADSDLDTSEFEAMDAVKLYDVLGLQQADFVAILKDYLEDLSKEAETNDRVSLLKPERVDAILAQVTERKYRLIALATALNICKGDHALNNAELALFQHIMNQWQIDLTDLEIAVSQ